MPFWSRKRGELDLNIALLFFLKGISFLVITITPAQPYFISIIRMWLGWEICKVLLVKVELMLCAFFAYDKTYLNEYGKKLIFIPSLFTTFLKSPFTKQNDLSLFLWYLRTAILFRSRWRRYSSVSFSALILQRLIMAFPEFLVEEFPFIFFQ